MGLSINDIAPDVEQETAQATITCHHWIGDSRAAPFPHPEHFMSICTSGLGYRGRIEPQSAERGVTFIGLSVDATGDRETWADDVFIAGSVSSGAAKEVFGSWEQPKSHLRIVPRPS